MKILSKISSDNPPLSTYFPAPLQDFKKSPPFFSFSTKKEDGGKYSFASKKVKVVLKV